MVPAKLLNTSLLLYIFSTKKQILLVGMSLSIGDKHVGWAYQPNLLARNDAILGII